MIRKFIYFFYLIFLFSCSHSKIHFLQNFTSEEIKSYKIQIKSLEINFKERRILPLFKEKPDKYLSKNEIEEIMLEHINKTLDEDGFLANYDSENIFECDVVIDFDRVYLIFSANTYIGTLHKGHKIDFYKNQKIIATKNDKSKRFAKLGFKEESKKLTKNLTLTYSKEDEVKEIISFSIDFAKELEKITK